MISLQSTLWPTVLGGVGIFLVITLLLVIILLVAKKYLVSSGNVTVTINNDKKVEVAAGQPLLSAMAASNVFLPSACGGKGSCGQCRVQVTAGGGEILPTEAVHFTRKEIKEDWRLACQVKVKNDLDIKVAASILDIKEDVYKRQVLLGLVKHQEFVHFGERNAEGCVFSEFLHVHGGDSGFLAGEFLIIGSSRFENFFAERFGTPGLCILRVSVARE